MNLIDKYVTEVGKHLPRKNRLDIQAELRSTLQDMLEDRRANQAAGSAASDEAVRTLLKEYGSPRQVAETYAGPRFLIGPHIYPFFEMVVGIVLAVLVGVSLFGLVVSVIRTGAAGPEFIASLGKFAMGLISGMIAAFGNIVLVFAILERTLPMEKWGDEQKDWDPAELEREPDPDKVKIGEQIATIVFTAAGLAIFNLYPQIIGLYFMKDGNWTGIPLLSPAFFTYLPWINLLGVTQILFALWLLRRGAWTTSTRLGDIVVEGAGILLAGAMLVGPSLVSIDAQTLANTELAGAAGPLALIFSNLPRMILVILIIIQSVEIVQTLVRIVRSSQGRAFPTEF